MIKKLPCMARKKRHTFRRAGGSPANPLYPKKKTKIAPKCNLFPSKVGGMNYSLEEHTILSLLTTAKA